MQSEIEKYENLKVNLDLIKKKIVTPWLTRQTHVLFKQNVQVVKGQCQENISRS